MPDSLGRPSVVLNGLGQSERTDRPFTIEFLTSAAREAENLDEFLAALRSHKEARAFDSDA